MGSIHVVMEVRTNIEFTTHQFIYARHNAIEAEMKEVARTANARHFISSLPHGYDTHVDQDSLHMHIQTSEPSHASGNLFDL